MNRFGFILILLPLHQTLHAEERGLATFTPPSGWARQVSATFETYTHVTGGSFCQLAIYDDQNARAAAEEFFAAEWGAVFGDRFLPGPPPRPRQRTSPAGQAFPEGESEVSDRSGNRFYARLAVFRPAPSRVQSFVWIAASQAALAGCEPQWQAFLASLRFPSAAPAPAAAPAARGPSIPGQFENFRYTAPAGWTEQRKSNLVSLAPARFQEGEQLALVLLTSRPAAPLERELESTWNEIVALYGAQPMRNVSGRAYDAESVRRSAAGWDYLVANGGFMVNSQSFSVRPYLFRVRDRIERLFVLAADFRADLVNTNAMSSPRFEPEIFRFIFTLRFAGAETAPSRAPAEAQGPGIEGVWGGSAMSFGKLKVHLAVFFTDRSAWFGTRFPERGLLGIDPAVERERTPRDWGTWSMSGSSGVLRMPYGDVPLRLEGNALVVTTAGTPHRYIRLPVPAAAQLAGTWCLGDSGEGPCLMLGADGRFRDEGALRELEHTTYPYPLSLPRGSGTYELKQQTLLFRYDNGSEFPVAFPGLLTDKPEPRPSRLWLSFNLDALTRR